MSYSHAELQAARDRAVAAGYTNRHEVMVINDHVVLTLSRRPEERAAATDFTRGEELFAAEWDEEYGPRFAGASVHKAFLAGIAWQKEREP